MEKTKLSGSQKAAINALMHDYGISAATLQYALDLHKLYGGLPEPENGEKLPLELRYEDNSLSTTFLEGVRVKAVHTLGVDVSLEDAPIPLPYVAAVKFCQQAGCSLMSETDAQLILSEKKKINRVLKSICGKPLQDYVYWLDAQGSKPYLAKVVDFSAGTIREVGKNQSFRVRPVKH